jgi:hypothetical protein
MYQQMSRSKPSRSLRADPSFAFCTVAPPITDCGSSLYPLSYSPAAFYVAIGLACSHTYEHLSQSEPLYSRPWITSGGHFNSRSNQNQCCQFVRKTYVRRNCIFIIMIPVVWRERLLTTLKQLHSMYQFPAFRFVQIRTL